jgi:hypothetical protein
MADTNEPKLVDVRKIGKKGGQSRAENMTPEERSQAASKAAKARWKEVKKAKKAAKKR